MTRLTNPKSEASEKVGPAASLLSQPEIRKPGGRLRNGELFSCTRSHWSYGGKRALMDPIECAEARIHQAWTSNEFSRPDTTLRCPRWHPLARYHVRPLKLLIDAISEQRFNIVSQAGDRFSIYWVILSTSSHSWQTILVVVSLFLFIRRRRNPIHCSAILAARWPRLLACYEFGGGSTVSVTTNHLRWKNKVRIIVVRWQHWRSLF